MLGEPAHCSDECLRVLGRHDDAAARVLEDPRGLAGRAEHDGPPGREIVDHLRRHERLERRVRRERHEERVARGEHRHDVLRRELRVEADVLEAPVVRLLGQERLHRAVADEREVREPFARSAASSTDGSACAMPSMPAKVTRKRSARGRRADRGAPVASKNSWSVPFGIRTVRGARSPRIAVDMFAERPRHGGYRLGAAVQLALEQLGELNGHEPAEIWFRLVAAAGQRSRTSSTKGARFSRAIASRRAPVKSGGVVATTTSHGR